MYKSYNLSNLCDQGLTFIWITFYWILKTNGLYFLNTVAMDKINSVLTIFSLFSACVWLHCEITTVFDQFFTFLSFYMIALWNHCRFYHLFTIVCLCMIALWKHCRFRPLFYNCLLVYDCKNEMRWIGL